jgi:hypothetical protein
MPKVRVGAAIVIGGFSMAGDFSGSVPLLIALFSCSSRRDNK